MVDGAMTTDLASLAENVPLRPVMLLAVVILIMFVIDRYEIYDHERFRWRETSAANRAGALLFCLLFFSGVALLFVGTPW
jgi:hypothetical protein